MIVREASCSIKITMSKIRSILKWLGEKPYTKAAYICAFATCILAVVACISLSTLFQNQQVLKHNEIALQTASDALSVERSALSNAVELLFLERADRMHPALELRWVPRLPSEGKGLHYHFEVRNNGTALATDISTEWTLVLFVTNAISVHDSADWIIPLPSELPKIPPEQVRSMSIMPTNAEVIFLPPGPKLLYKPLCGGRSVPATLRPGQVTILRQSSLGGDYILGEQAFAKVSNHFPGTPILVTHLHWKRSSPTPIRSYEGFFYHRYVPRRSKNGRIERSRFVPVERDPSLIATLKKCRTVTPKQQYFLSDIGLNGMWSIDLMKRRIGCWDAATAGWSSPSPLSQIK